MVVEIQFCHCWIIRLKHKSIKSKLLMLAIINDCVLLAPLAGYGMCQFSYRDTDIQSIHTTVQPNRLARDKV